MADERPDLGVLLGRVGRRLVAEERPILERHGVTMWQYAVLARLSAGPAPTQLTLAADVGYDKNRLVALLDDLESAGLVRRMPDPSDRRARVVELTAAGRRRFASAQREVRAMEERLLAELPPADRAALVRSLTALAEGA